MSDRVDASGNMIDYRYFTGQWRRFLFLIRAWAAAQWLGWKGKRTASFRQDWRIVGLGRLTDSNGVLLN